MTTKVVFVKIVSSTFIFAICTKRKEYIMFDDYDNDDNMRGWDPASEDDMPDNGMDRYAENNDERGWV